MILKEVVQNDLKESNCPLAFLDYCIEHKARVNNITEKTMSSLHGSNTHTSLTCKVGDILSLYQYRWYDWCYYREEATKFPFNKKIMGQFICPASGEVNVIVQ